MFELCHELVALGEKMKLIIYVFLIFAIAGCAGEKVTAESAQVSENQPQAEKQAENMINVTGTIVFKGMEGGFYALDADDGRKFMPQGMNKDMLKHGMKVQVTGIILKDMMTFQQYGEVLKVTEAVVLDDSKAGRLEDH